MTLNLAVSPLALQWNQPDVSMPPSRCLHSSSFPPRSWKGSSCIVLVEDDDLVYGYRILRVAQWLVRRSRWDVRFGFGATRSRRCIFGRIRSTLLRVGGSMEMIGFWWGGYCFICDELGWLGRLWRLLVWRAVVTCFLLTHEHLLSWPLLLHHPLTFKLVNCIDDDFLQISTIDVQQKILVGKDSSDLRDKKVLFEYISKQTTHY